MTKISGFTDFTKYLLNTKAAKYLTNPKAAGAAVAIAIVSNVTKDGIDICCGGSTLRVTEIQMPGKKRVSVDAFLRGNKIEKGIVLD